MARAMNECSIALALPVRATNTMMWRREPRVFGPRDLILVDLSAPYVYTWPDDGASDALHVDVDTLGLPMDLVRAAAAQLHTSPIHDLVRDHVARLTLNARTLEDTAAAGHLGAASVELMHALVVSAAQDGARAADALRRSTTTRVQAYVRHHLRDPQLSPERIAVANGLSVRARCTACTPRSGGASNSPSSTSDWTEHARTCAPPGSGTAPSGRSRGRGGSRTPATSPGGSGKRSDAPRGSGAGPGTRSFPEHRRDACERE